MARFVIVIAGLIFVYLIIQGILGMVGSTFVSLQEFFLHSTWGIIAVVCGVLSMVFVLISAKLPKAMRESKTRTEAIAPLIHSLSNNNKLYSMDNNEIQKQEPEIDLENMNLENFFRDVAFTLNKPTALVFKGWSNKRLSLDVEHVEILRSYLEAVRGTCDQYLQLKADVFFSKEKFEYFCKLRVATAKHELDLVEERFKNEKWYSDYNRRLKEAILVDREIEQEEKRMQIQEQKLRNEFFSLAMKEYPDMPQALQAYIFTQVHGRFPAEKRDFGMEEKIHDFIVKKNNIELLNLENDAKMKKEETKTFTEKMKHERNKKYE